MREVIDRIENGIAVLVSDSGKARNVAVVKLPKGVKEGDVLVDGKVSKVQTNSAKKRVENLLRDIFQKK